jgi:hypothetical protein
MGIELFDLGPPGIAEQAMLHLQYDLGDNFQVAVDEHIERVGHDPLGGILNRHDSVIRAVLADFGKDVGDGLLVGVPQAGAEPADGRLVGEGGFRPEIRDGHRFFERQGARHDLAVKWRNDSLVIGPGFRRAMRLSTARSRWGA